MYFLIVRHVLILHYLSGNEQFYFFFVLFFSCFFVLFFIFFIFPTIWLFVFFALFPKFILNSFKISLFWFHYIQADHGGHLPVLHLNIYRWYDYLIVFFTLWLSAEKVSFVDYASYSHVPSCTLLQPTTAQNVFNFSF